MTPEQIEKLKLLIQLQDTSTLDDFLKIFLPGPAVLSTYEETILFIGAYRAVKRNAYEIIDRDYPEIQVTGDLAKIFQMQDDIEELRALIETIKRRLKGPEPGQDSTNQ